MNRRVTHDGHRLLEVRFPFDRALVDLVKSLPGRRWNAGERFWTVPEDHVVELVDQLGPRQFRFDAATIERYRDGGGQRVLDADTTENPGQPGLFDTPDSVGSPAATTPAHLEAVENAHLTVGQLNERVREVLQTAFPGAVSLVGEIRGFDKNAHRKHVGFQLVEVDADGQVESQISATVFQSSRAEIERRLAAAGDPFRLQDEIEVRVEARVELYVPWGSYRVIVEGIDVDYTLGEAARRREEILRRLEAEGLLEQNRERPLSPFPLRVGLITSLGSDAYNDVVRTLEESGYAFSIVAHGARVQGRSTEPSLLNALDRLAQMQDRLDVVLICRGGGSRTDLAWFDSEPLGRAIAAYPLPVIAGIGHEEDRCVADAMARRARTPTAAAGLLVQRVRESFEQLSGSAAMVLERAGARLEAASIATRERAHRLATAGTLRLERERRLLGERERRAVQSSRHLLSAARERLVRQASVLPARVETRVLRAHDRVDGLARRIPSGGERQLRDAEARLSAVIERLPRAAERQLSHEAERHRSRERRLGLLAPQRVLDRGYAILRRADGRAVTDAATVSPTEKMSARLARGSLELQTIGIHPEDEERDG